MPARWRKTLPREKRRRIHDVLDDLMASDRHVVPLESSLLSVVKEALQI